MISCMFKHVEHWCESNVAFSMRKSPRNSKKSNLAPNERVVVDVLGPFPSLIQAVDLL